MNRESPAADLPPSCLSCGYTLTGLGKEPVCPECGEKAQSDYAILALHPSPHAVFEAGAAALLTAAILFVGIRYGFKRFDFLMFLFIGIPSFFALRAFRRQRRVTHVIANRDGIRWVKHGWRAEFIPWSQLPELHYLPDEGLILCGSIGGPPRFKIESSRTDGREATERFFHAASAYREQWNAVEHSSVKRP